MSRVLITGINGFVGKHLARELASQAVDIAGCSHETSANPELINSCREYQMCDLSDPSQVAGLALENIDAVINLAGLANVGASRDSPDEYLRTNVAVHAVLCEELLKRNLNPRIIAISTGAVYSPDQPMPQNENGLLVTDDKTAPYVVSKKRMEEALGRYRSAGLNIIIARPFNHIGPGQRPGFLVPDLAEEIMVAGESDRALRVGNLNTKRDYTDVRDVAKAYACLVLAKTLKSDTYNVCSGQSRSGLEMLGLLKAAFHKNNLQTEIDPARIRPNDIMDIYGSAERIRSEFDWTPQIPIEQTIRDFAAWRLAQEA